MNSEIALKFAFFGMVLLAVALEVAGDILFKKWSIESKNVIFIAGLATYMVGTIFWAVSLKYEFLSKAISVFTILNLIVVVLAGVIIFKEDLSTINKLGIIMGVASIILMEI